MSLTDEIEFRTEDDQDQEQVSSLVEQQATNFVDYLDEHDELSRRQQPESVASGVVYAAVQALELLTPMRVVADTAGVSDTTVETYYSLVRVRLMMSFESLDDLNTELSYVVDEADVVNTILASDPELLVEHMSYKTHV